MGLRRHSKIIQLYYLKLYIDATGSNIQKLMYINFNNNNTIINVYIDVHMQYNMNKRLQFN